MKVNQDWDAESSIYRILAEINQLIINKEPVVLSQLITKHKASGTLSTILKTRGYLVVGEKKHATWSCYEGKALPLGESDLHKLAGKLAEDTRELKYASKKKVETEKATEGRLKKVYKPLENRQTTLLCKRQQEIQKRQEKPQQIINLNILLQLKSFIYERPTCVTLFGEFFQDVQQVDINTCEFAENLLVTLKQNNITIQKSFLVEENYAMIEDGKIGFGLQYVK